MGRYNSEKYKPIMVPIDVYERLSRRKRTHEDSFAEVLRGMLYELDQKAGKPTGFNLVLESPTFNKTVKTPSLRREFAPTKLKVEE